MDSLTSSIVGLRLAESMASIQYAVAAKLLQSESLRADAALDLIRAAEQTYDSAAADVVDSITGTLDTYA